MYETQARMTLRGALEHPIRVLSCRSGSAYYRGRARGGNQQSRSLAVEETTRSEIEGLTLIVLDKLARFRGVGAELNLHLLIRRREITGIPDYRQAFSGYWGSLAVDGAWTSVFGSDPNVELVFRRGMWEEWSRKTSRMEGVRPGIPLILSPYCGTLLHETVGHAMEAEYLPESPLKPHLGEQVSHSRLTIMDRPDLDGYAGSMTHDDAGLPASETTMIHRGFLVGDLDHGRGVLRRGSYQACPLIRASNFIIRPGRSDPRDWVHDLEECYYISWIQSGNWQPGGQLIKVLTGPVFHLKKGRVMAASDWTYLVFSTLDLLAGILDVGADMCMDPVVHWCMKKHQAIPMSLGSPSLLLGGVSS